MSPDVLAALDALEAATVGSRELDREVAWVIADNRQEHDGERCIAVCWGPRETWFLPLEAVASIPLYTTSIEAALTLVPKGHGIKMRRYWRLEPGEWWSVMLHWGISGDHVVADDVPTAPLALYIAALRARHSQVTTVSAGATQ